MTWNRIAAEANEAVPLLRGFVRRAVEEVLCEMSGVLSMCMLEAAVRIRLRPKTRQVSTPSALEYKQGCAARVALCSAPSAHIGVF